MAKVLKRTSQIDYVLAINRKYCQFVTIRGIRGRSVIPSLIKHEHVIQKNLLLHARENPDVL